MAVSRGGSALGGSALGGSALGGVCSGGCLLLGVSALGGRVSAQGGVCSGGSAPRGRGCGIPACTEADTPPRVDRHTPVKT